MRGRTATAVVLTGLLLAVVWLLAGAARADTPAPAEVSAARPESLVAVLEGAGFAARLGRTRRGDPLIHATTPGALPFQIRFYGCRGGEACVSVQLVALFAARGVPLETLNRWNAAMRFGRVHATEGGQPVLSLDIGFAPAGLTAAQMSAQLVLWERLMEGMLGLLAED